MASGILFSEMAPPEASASTADSAAAVSDALVTLRFRLVSADDRGLEALRYARRAMLREEWTRGIEEGEPSLEDAVFSAFDVAWSVPASSHGACRAKLGELIARANRTLADMSGTPPAAGRTDPSRPS